MGRRSRKRVSHEAAPPPPPAVERAGARAARAAPSAHRDLHVAPRGRAAAAPWAPFPLTELDDPAGHRPARPRLRFATGDRRAVLLGGGFVLVTLSAGELSLREHFAGYRSHSSLLAGLVAVVVAIPF